MSKAMTAASKEQLVELMQYLSQNISVPTIGIGGGFAPIGTIISYMGTTAPQDYLICDGTTYNIADYKQLSDFFAAQFGSANFFGGDGVSTFKVPDLRGEFLRGTGTNGHSGEGDGANVGEHRGGTEVLYMDGEGSKLYTHFETSWSGMGYVDKLVYGSTGRNQVINTDDDSVSQSPVRAKVRPTNTSVLYCIKAVAAGDVYSTEERVVGTWIDGKPIYQKTINITSGFPSLQEGRAFYPIADLASLSIDRMINVWGYFCQNYSVKRFPFTDNGSLGVYSLNLTYHTSGAASDIREKLCILCTIPTGGVLTITDLISATIQYTKTTD